MPLADSPPNRNARGGMQAAMRSGEARRKRRAGSRRWLVILAAVLLLFYAAAGYFGSAGMFGDHPRWCGMNRGPADFGLQGETVAFTSLDGIPLKAWWLPASGTSRAAVIIAPGIDHTRQVMLPRAAFLVHDGYDALPLDLRGHGESGGSVVSPGLLEARDILGALRYIRQRRGNEPVAVMGVSYGAAASLIAAAQSSDIAAVISDGTFPTGKEVSEDIARHFIHDSRTSLGLRALFLVSSVPGISLATALVYYARTGINLGPQLVSVLAPASRIHTPVLLISGDRDWIVPTYRAREILSALPDSRKQLVVIPGAVHDTTYSTAPSLYAETVLTFLAESINAPAVVP